MGIPFVQNAKTMGKYRWVVYGVVVITYFFVYFHRLSVGIVRNELIAAFAMSATAFANLGAMYFYAYMFMQIPTGILADTLGARKTVTVGSLVTGLGAILFGLAPTGTYAYIGRMLVGLGVSVTYICLLKIQTVWFEESKFGTMTGIAGFIGHIGGVIAQTPLAYMVLVFTWRYTFVGVGLISLILAVLCFVLVRDYPEDLGFQPLVGNKSKKDLTYKMNKTIIKEGLVNVAKNYRTWLSFIIITAYCGTYFVLTGTWGVGFLSDVYNMEMIEGSKYISILVFGAAIGSLVIGVFSDRIKSRKKPLLLFGTLVNILWYFLLYKEPSLNMLAVLMFILGVVYMCFTMTWALGKESNDPKYSGMAISVVNLGGFLGGAIVPVLVGNVFDRYQGIFSGIMLYRKGFMICIIVNLIALAVSMFVKETKCKNIYSSPIKL